MSKKPTKNRHRPPVRKSRDILIEIKGERRNGGVPLNQLRAPHFPDRVVARVDEGRVTAVGRIHREQRERTGQRW